MQLFCEKKSSSWLNLLLSVSSGNFKNRAKTELYLAHHRVPRGMGIAKWHDVMWRTFGNSDVLFSLFAVPKFTSQSVTAQARPRFPIARYWIKISSHSRGHKKSRISPNQKTIGLKYSRKYAHSFKGIKIFGVRCTLTLSHSNHWLRDPFKKNTNGPLLKVVLLHHLSN